MLAVPLPARDPLTPFGIHVLVVKIRRVVNVHVAIETTKAILHKLLREILVRSIPPDARSQVNVELECWSTGVLQEPITPSLHHSNTPILFPYPQLPLNVPYDVEVGDFRVRHRPLDLHCLPTLIYHELQTAFRDAAVFAENFPRRIVSRRRALPVDLDPIHQG